MMQIAIYILFAVSAALSGFVIADFCVHAYYYRKRIRKQLDELAGD